MNQTRQKGFTLIELLIVITIIGILASIVLLGVGRIGPAARDARRVTELRQLQHALEVYNRQCGYYPGVADMSGACGMAGFVLPSWAELTASLNAVGFSVVPNDPTTGIDYRYGANAMGTTYILGAVLEEPASPLFKSSLGNPDTVAGTLLNNPAVTFHCGSTAMPPTYCLQF